MPRYVLGSSVDTWGVLSFLLSLDLSSHLDALVSAGAHLDIDLSPVLQCVGIVYG